MTWPPLILELPLPDRRLSPNQAKRGRTAGARRMRRALAASYRRTVQLLTLEACDGLRPAWPAAVGHSVWFMPDRRHRDRDNLAASFKPGWDGIVDAGVLEDDRHLLPMPPRLVVDRERPRLVVVLEHCQPDDLLTKYLPPIVADLVNGAIHA